METKNELNSSRESKDSVPVLLRSSLPPGGPKIPVGTKKCVEWGFGYGESEYEVRFGQAPSNGELSRSDIKTTKPFNSSIRTRNPGHIYPEIKGRWKIDFF